MNHAVARLTTVVTAVREAYRSRAEGQDPEAGASALEYVIIAVGAIIVAGLVVAAITAFVNGKIAQIG